MSERSLIARSQGVTTCDIFRVHAAQTSKQAEPIPGPHMRDEAPFPRNELMLR